MECKVILYLWSSNCCLYMRCSWNFIFQLSDFCQLSIFYMQRYDVNLLGNRNHRRMLYHEKGSPEVCLGFDTKVRRISSLITNVEDNIAVSSWSYWLCDLSSISLLIKLFLTVSFPPNLLGERGFCILNSLISFGKLPLLNVFNVLCSFFSVELCSN